MIYELRVYRSMPGRLPELTERFARHTLAIWERHGIRPVGFWTTMIGDSTRDLTYMLAWTDLGERERVWDGFMTCAEWAAVRAETEKNGPLIENVKSSLLSPTAFSRLR